MRTTGLDAAGTLTAIEANEAALIEHETRRLALAAHWADLHPGDAVDLAGLPGRERAVQPGGDGTPEVAQFCFADVGVAMQATAGTAARLIADGLDLRHRLPLTWAAVRSGNAPVWQARRIAAATRHLTREQARQVDARVVPSLGTVSWGRLQTIMEAAVFDADPEGAEAAAELAARQRFVRLGRTTEHGLRHIWAKVSAGDAMWGDACIARLAVIMKQEGDLDSLDTRRSKAFGLLISQPAEALAMLQRHRHDESDDVEPDDTDVDPSEEEDEPADHWARPEPVEGPTAGSEVQSANNDAAGTRSLQILPPPFDPARVRPRAVLYVHISEEALSAGRGVARVEDVGPVLLSRIRQLVGDRCLLLLKPVIDLNDTPAPVDSYEIPSRLAEHLRLRQSFDVFPYAAGGSRRADLDHTIAYRPLKHGGPPGQTAVGKLGPFGRYHHRVKTHGRWRLRQPEPGTYLWRSPWGRIFLVTATGTHRLGHGAWAQQIWRAAKAPPSQTATEPAADPPPDGANDSQLERVLRGLIDAHSLTG